MGKKQAKEKKKFDRNVEISAPILDPQAIKAIHTNPFSLGSNRLDIKSFKALLGGHNSQDSIDELTPLNDNHVPSYIGISCAVSGYSNYSSYNRRPGSPTSTVKSSTNPIVSQFNPSRSRTASPIAPHQHQVNHVTIDRNNIHSADEERKELTEKLVASATEPRRSPSPCIPPTEDDRHHGAYVGARYCPLPPPSKVVNKHIPLLGIDDDQDPDEVVEQDENKVEQRIASLYGDEFVEDWRESMTHKTKKEIAAEEQEPTTLKSPKDLVSLKPTPLAPVQDMNNQQPEIDIPAPNVKVLAQVEKQFLNKLLSDENPPTPSQAGPYSGTAVTPHKAETKPADDDIQKPVVESTKLPPQPSPPASPSPAQAEQVQSMPVDEQPPSPSPLLMQEDEPEQPPQPPLSPESRQSQSIADEDVDMIPSSQVGEDHIEYEIRAQSPVDNNASPVKIPHHQMEELSITDVESEHNLVNFSPETRELTDESGLIVASDQKPSEATTDTPVVVDVETSNNNEERVGRYYLDLLDKERGFLLEQVEHAKTVLSSEEAEAKMDQDVKGMILSANGKAQLLINKKFKQFEELCEANINKSADEQFATLNDDLAGFWDMLNIQVSEIRKSFEILREAEANDWKIGDSHKPFVTADTATTEQRDGNVEEPAARSTNIRDKSSAKSKLSAQRDQERRERLQEHINQMKQQSQATKMGSGNLLSDLGEETFEQQATEFAQNLPLESTNERELTSAEVEAEQEEQMFSLIGVEPVGIVASADSAETAQPDPPVQIENDGNTNLVDLSEP